MLSKLDLKRLAERAAMAGSPVLSVFLDIDQSRAVNLNREFEVRLKNLVRSVEQRLGPGDQLKAFREDAQPVLDFVTDYRPRGKTLVLFSDASQGFFWQRDVNVNLESQIHWNDRPHVRPLFEAMDEYERYGVILVDRAQARLFTVYLGQVEEHREAFAAADVHHFDATAKDNMRSQMQFQRKQDMHVLWHLKEVAKLSDRLAEVYKYDRLVLAGTAEATAELERHLPERLKRRLVRVLSLPLEASNQEILAKTLKCEAEVERQKEEILVQRLITGAAKDGQAVTGLEGVLKTLQEGRIRQLVYSMDFSAQGSHCPNCQILLSDRREDCPYCHSSINPVEDLVEEVVGRVVDSGGEVEQVRERAAEQLREFGGVGAFLRF